MSKRFPPPPTIGTPILATRPSPEARALLARRRSAGKNFLVDPGPTPDQVDELLRVAARVPDHRRVEPWRFIVFEGEARATAGKHIARIYAAEHPESDPIARKTEAERLSRAPVVIAVISAPEPTHKTPIWEQELSVGAVCQTLLLAANAAGWAGVWLSEWLAFDPNIAHLLALSPTERVAGFIYIGTASLAPPERARPNIAEKTTRWTAPN